MGMNVLPRSLLVLNLYFDDKLFGQHDFGDMIGEFSDRARPAVLRCGIIKATDVAWRTLHFVRDRCREPTGPIAVQNGYQSLVRIPA